MGKRSNFERKERDFYPTPYEAVVPLLPHIITPYSARGHVSSFIEPCAGDGRLIKHLEKHGHKCTWAADIEPQAPEIERADVLMMGFKLPECELIITNPPWERNQDGTGPLHEMIELFRNHAPTWLLFDADWMFTGQARPFLQYCSKIVAVGRVSWMGNGSAGMDNACWYHFQANKTATIFCGK